MNWDAISAVSEVAGAIGVIVSMGSGGRDSSVDCAVTADTLLQRARERCSHDRQVPGFCRDCVMEELQEMMLEENSELCPGDAQDLAWEWAARADEAEH